MAGGFGTRLRPLSCTRPKIAFPIVNKPLLQWTYERLVQNDIGEAVLAVDYRTEALLKQYRIPRCGLYIRYSRDPKGKPLGTGGPIKKAEKLVGNASPFLTLNGDIFADVPYRKILEAHRSNRRAVATIALREVEDPSRYGVAELTQDNHIKRFIEKPSREKAPTNLINAGVYVLSPKIFEYIPANRAVSIEYEIFPKLADEGKLYGYSFDGQWFDMGKLDDYLKLNKILLDSSNVSQKVERRNKVTVEGPVALDKGVAIAERSVIGPYAILGRNVTVGRNSHIRESVIFPETTISDDVSIGGSIIGEGAVIGKGVKIGEGCTIGDHVKVRDNLQLTKRVSICPAKEVCESILTPRNVV
jgi:mannose-1-phosphate guanylyltransferase